MRKHHKKQCLELLDSLEEAHKQIASQIAKKNVEDTLQLLEDCQQAAIQIGTVIDEMEGEGTEAVHILEDYCELTYSIHEGLANGQNVNGRQAEKKLKKIINRAKNEIRDGLSTQYETVFLPYKASMWDSLESVWKAADEDENCNAYVIPVPYYDKNPDGSFAQLHYEGDLFPDYVPITNYGQYDFENRHPDMIYFHNGYDAWNLVTEVLPKYHSDKLKEWTDELVYIPYYVLGEPPESSMPNYTEWLKNHAHFFTIPGVMNAHRVIVQSEAMKKAYVKVLTDYAGKDTKNIWEKKIEGTGSPKFDRLLSLKKEDLAIPEEWQRIIKKPDGTDKKIIFYNTSVGSLLTYDKLMLKKMRQVFETFKENKEEVALLWRPHPLIQAAVEAMRPQLWQEYDEIVRKYRSEGWGIHDDSADIDRAIVISDAYYGDMSSVVWLCQRAGMPVMIQNPIEAFDPIRCCTAKLLYEYLESNKDVSEKVWLNIADDDSFDRAVMLLEELVRDGSVEYVIKGKNDLEIEVIKGNGKHQ